ncbi:SDR family NAD(P)-dependent oxidoreductase [Mesorhizobium sp. M8A.F.Ca.ET.197.01.1.1]|nr:SDR family NAD(P)-dependent oxidoreductase [Mesorhizobium sp. M8A.F.Ca.ET.197.01.1.1]TGR23194.1 SDR family oxidoreductase [Mesorhizobium sp. M8A.F.Ca.ET.197.01.1.1]TGR39103.1 SDR family oxidoreductase [bacterium M00.F.Ca.ET.199.01.1.1]TGR46872.1 SDR family oxidoreductase [Mesorhizobium sp. M8A.F.Ca.ET.198.01.1.1]TGV85328.1 SDR family oxidoreductase [Mesorhizobium sp. M00.F.Ca.ET.149.01.1.1]
MGRLQGKIAIVTGGADGIGRAITEAFAQEGAHVFAADIADAKGEKLVAELKAKGLAADYQHCDVGVEADIRMLVEAVVTAGGRLDIIVNNAAIALGGMPIYDMTDEQWHRLININLTSVFRSCKYALPQMIRQRRGSIINMASVQAHLGFEGWTAYAAAKGAILAMSRQMAVEFGPHNVRVNSVSPGSIATPMYEQTVAEIGEQLGRAWVKMHPIGRIGKSAEVAEAMVYLASDAAGFTTGMDLRVDGGAAATPRFVPDLV